MKRLMTFTLALCMTTLLTSRRASADAMKAQMTGKALYDICKNKAEIAQAVCGAYILGALDMVDAVTSFKPPKKLCPRPEENSDTMQRSYVANGVGSSRRGDTHRGADNRSADRLQTLGW